MGGWHLPSHVVRDDDSASLFQGSPLPAGSSPSPLLLHGGEAKKRAPSATRRRIVVRSMCSPIAAIFRMTCVRAVGSSDDQPSSDKTCDVERGSDQARRRPSLEELLRSEAAAAAAAACEVSCGKEKESAVVVFGFAADDSLMSCTEEEEEEEEEAPLAAVSKNRHVVSGRRQQQQTAVVVPVELDLQRPVAALDDDGRAGLSGTVQARVQRVVLILASLRARSSRALRIDAGPSRGRLYWKLPAGGNRAGGGKAELFYHRPISMGRRCRVQHLEESPYM